MTAKSVARTSSAGEAMGHTQVVVICTVLMEG